MIIKGKLTKHVWVDDEKWKVEKVISPTKYDDYLLLSRVRDEEIHEDGKTEPVDMCLIDCHNYEFYPDNPRVRKIMKERQEERTKKREGDTLDNLWMQFFRE